MFERFSDHARMIMARANQEAQIANHGHIASEHILLGLVTERACVGAQVLSALDVDLKKVRRNVESLMKAEPGTAASGRLPQTSGAKTVIIHAIEEARNLDHAYVGSEHFLIGLVRDDGIAGVVLRNLGLVVQDVREEVVSILAARAEEGGAPSPPPVPNCPLCQANTAISANPSFIATLHSGHVVLGDNQGCRGWCVLILKDHREHMDDLPISAQSIIFEDVARIAAAIRSVFPTSGKGGGPPRINYECLGNLVPHIHWHIIPRHADDPEPTKAVWGWTEERLKGTMTVEERKELVLTLRGALGSRG